MEGVESSGRTESSSVALKRHTELSPQEAFQLLERDDIITVAVPPVRPKGGEIYLFKPDKELNAGKLLNFCTEIIWCF